jgi:hypothetical protein
MKKNKGRAVRVVQAELPDGTVQEATTQREVENAIWDEIHGKRFYLAEQAPICKGKSSQLQPIQVGYSIPVFCCISYIVAWYFVPITCIGHSARTAMQQESHDTSFNVPHKKVGLLLNS